MKNKICHISLLVFLTLSFTGGSEVLCKTSQSSGLLLKEADQCRRSLYRSAQMRKYRHNWLNCISRYKRLYTRYPKTNQAVWALYHSAQLFTELYHYSGISKDLDEAIRFYRRLLVEHKDHRLADDAQYLIGSIFYKYKKSPSRNWRSHEH